MQVLFFGDNFCENSIFLWKNFTVENSRFKQSVLYLINNVLFNKINAVIWYKTKNNYIFYAVIWYKTKNNYIFYAILCFSKQ